MEWRHRLLILAMLFGLAACGGGGGGGTATPPPPPPPTATSAELAAAKAAKVSAVLDLSTKATTLSWSDTFAAGTAYAIEQQAGDGSWQAIDSVPGTSGTGGALQWTHTTNASVTLRVAVQRTGYEVPLDTTSGATSVAIAVPSATPSIALDQVEPVAGSVNLSIQGGGTYTSVAWFVDLNAIGSSTTPPGYGVVLNASGLTSGPHLLLAQLSVSPDVTLEVRRTIQVANPEVAVQVSVSGTSGLVNVNVNATSAYGITSVTAFLDGTSLGTLTAPNCAGFGCGATYQFPVNATTAGSGVHTVSATATDGNGVSASTSTTVTFSNPPRLTVTSPFDGALVNGTLSISGTFATDKPNTPVTVTATLGSVPVLSATTSPFTGSFSLAGVNPGTYTLTVVATDGGGLTTTVADQVTVTSSPALVYTPRVTMGSGGSLLAVSTSNLLYSASDGSIHALTGSTDRVLSVGTLTNLSGWQISDSGAVYAQAFGTDRAAGPVSIYAWPAGATNAINLSNAVGSLSNYDQLLPVHEPWILWASLVTSNWNQYTLYNVATGQTLTIPAPAGVTLVGNIGCDFALVNGSLTLFYWTETVPGSGPATTDVYRWDQATGLSTRLTTDGLSLYPQWDGSNVVDWQTDHAAPPPNPPFSLTEATLGGASTVLSSSMSQFQRANGTVAWLDQTISQSGTVQTVTAQAIRASVNGTTTTLSTLLNTVLFGTSNGAVAYEASGKLYVWSPSTGSQVRYDSAPGQVHLAGGTLYFTAGSQGVVYAIGVP